MDRHSKHFPIKYLISNPTTGKRVEYHLLFWFLFLCFHLLYFLSSKEKIHYTNAWVVSYGIYYLRFIPVYYISISIFNILKNRYYGIRLILLLLICMVIVMHMLNVLVYLALDKIYGLSKLSDAFSYFGSFYLEPISQRNFQDWQSLLIYDIEELQILFFPVGLKMTQYGFKQQIQKLDLINQNLKTDLKMRNLQSAPHFVLNMINAAYQEMEPMEDRTPGYLQDLGDVLRFTLYETREDRIELYKEWHALLHFMHLEWKRFGDRLKLKVYCDGEITAGQYIPTLILFTLTENAFTHAVYPTDGPCWITVDLTVSQDHVVFKILNNRPRKKHYYKKKINGGIGLENIKKRLQIQYPDQNLVHLISSPDYYLVEVKLPFVAAAV